MLFDSGSDEHVCDMGFAPAAPTKNTTNMVEMHDARGNVIPHNSQRDGRIRLSTDKGDLKGKATFEVADAPGAIFSAGELVQTGYRSVLDA